MTGSNPIFSHFLGLFQNPPGGGQGPVSPVGNPPHGIPPIVGGGGMGGGMGMGGPTSPISPPHHIGFGGPVFGATPTMPPRRPMPITLGPQRSMIR